MPAWKDWSLADVGHVVVSVTESERQTCPGEVIEIGDWALGLPTYLRRAKATASKRCAPF